MRLRPVALAAALIPAVLLVPLLPVAASAGEGGTTVYRLANDSDASKPFPGPGELVLTPAEAGFELSGSARQVTVVVRRPGTTETLAFRAPDGEVLQVGRTYRGALNDGASTLTATQDSSQCLGDGSFTLTELDLDSSGRPADVAVAYEYLCRDATGSVRGSLAVRADTAPPALPSRRPAGLPTGTPPVHPAGTPSLLATSVDQDGDGRRGVAVRDLSTGRSRTVLGDGGADVTDPDLSRDGTRLAVSIALAARDGRRALAVAGADGSGLRQVTQPAAGSDGVDVDVDPHWSPDGQELLFSRYRLSDRGRFPLGLFRVRLDGGTPVPVPQTSGATWGRYDPTGTNLVYTTGTEFGNPAKVLYVSALDGSARAPLGVRGTSPVFSPDGRTVAYAALSGTDREGRAVDSRLALVPAAGGSATPLPATRTGTSLRVDRPAWAADGQSLLYERIPLDAFDQPLPDSRTDGVDLAGERAGPLEPQAVRQGDPSLTGPSAPVTAGGARSGFVPVAPQRLLDTRDGTGRAGVRGRAAPGERVSLAVRGIAVPGGTVPADVTAVVLNVTATGAAASTDVRVFPSGSPPSQVSNLNLTRGTTLANHVTVAVGADGRVVLVSGGAAVHLVADLAGYYREGGGVGLEAVEPVRLLDTRDGVGARRGTVGPGGVLDLQVTGRAVPADATAVVLNVTAVGASATTDVRVYPAAGAAVPQVSNLNVAARATVPNLVTVKLGPDGRVRLRNQAGQVHLLADLAGYYAPSAAARFVPAPPVRLLDTRTGTGAAPRALAAGEPLVLSVAGRAGVPGDARAVALNVTGTAVTQTTDVRLYPSGSGVPTASNLNLVRGLTRANAVLVSLSPAGQVAVRASSGSLAAVADLAGWFVA